MADTPDDKRFYRDRQLARLRALSDGVATKADLGSEISGLERRMFAMAIAVGGLVVAAIKYL